ncbi:CD276 antigen homolog isoform X2 [Salmo salar]|nr:CD276 antigen homolog isoform X2 [Salmo salar]
MKGTGKAEVQLKYAAFYTEPHLTVQAQHSYMTFLYETDGYPEPEVRWLDPHGHNLTHNISVTQSSRAPGLLLSLRTQLVMQAGGAVNFTFSLRNQVLEQVMERSLSYAVPHTPVWEYLPWSDESYSTIWQTDGKI